MEHDPVLDSFIKYFQLACEDAHDIEYAQQAVLERYVYFFPTYEEKFLATLDNIFQNDCYIP